MQNLLFINICSCQEKSSKMGSCVVMCGFKEQSIKGREDIYKQGELAAKIEQQFKLQAVQIQAEAKEEVQSTIEETIERQTRTNNPTIKSRFYHQTLNKIQSIEEEVPPIENNLMNVVSCQYSERFSTKSKKKQNIKRLLSLAQKSGLSLSGSLLEQMTEKISLDSQQFERRFICTLKQKEPLELISGVLTEEGEILIQQTLKYNQPTLLPAINFKNNSSYLGQWMNGMKHGKGKLEWLGGCVYEGEWAWNALNGFGKLIFSDGQIYEGFFKNSQAYGQGMYIYKDLSSYQGRWESNKPNGQGIQQFKNGEIYEGNWTNGQKNGYGQLFFEDGSYYKGSFRNNQLHGSGQYHWHNQKTYKGEWQHNEKSGFGVMEWANGDRYEGQFSHDKINGRGKFHEKNGRIYEGCWENGRKQGIFILHKKNGEIKTSEWYFNKFVRYIQNKGLVKIDSGRSDKRRTSLQYSFK